MNATTDFAQKYKIPDGIMAFVRAGFLEVAVETPDRATVEFRIPSLGNADSSDEYALYNLVWIHPDRKAEYYDENPGDLPNFYVRIDTEHSREDQVEDLDTIDDIRVRPRRRFGIVSKSAITTKRCLSAARSLVTWRR